MSESADEIRRSLTRLRAAREQIVRLAVQWQLTGLNTEPLTRPLIELQEGIAELESAVAPAIPRPPPPAPPAQ